MRDQSRVIAVADFDYVDTSGEPMDQHLQHQQRLSAFRQQLRNILATDGYRPVSIQCAANTCSAAAVTLAELIAAAKNSGANLLVFGGIHKMSTLVEWIQVTLFDVQTGKLLRQRLLTFRGDTDAAWGHAARYVGNLLNEELNQLVQQ
jgi:hypothetical protein